MNCLKSEEVGKVFLEDSTSMNSQNEPKVSLAFAFLKLAGDPCHVGVGFQDQVELSNLDANLFARTG